LARMATRDTRGAASFRNSRRLPTSSKASQVMPVMFPRGRPRLLTKPASIGSPLYENTIGTVSVALFAAEVAAPGVTIISTFSRTSSAASSGNRARLSPDRRSMMRFRPSR
jgi:hypothetical protein